MKTTVAFVIAIIGMSACIPSQATGLATCNSGSPESWQPQDKLQKTLANKGWKVNRIKIDGGCYEVYAINDKGERVEAYFHPQTLASVPTNPR